MDEIQYIAFKPSSQLAIAGSSVARYINNNSINCFTRVIYPDKLPLHHKPYILNNFRRASNGREADFFLGDKELAIEIKGSSRIHEGDIGPLQALMEDGPVKKCCIVCREKQPRQLTKNIEAIPWQIFVEQLWCGEFE